MTKLIFIFAFTTILSSVFVFLLPPITALPGEVDTAITFIVNLANPFSAFFPFVSFFLVLALIFTFEIGLLVFKIFTYFWNRVVGGS